MEKNVKKISSESEDGSYRLNKTSIYVDLTIKSVNKKKKNKYM